VLVLALFAGTRSPDIDNDYFLYQFYFTQSGLGVFTGLQTEVCTYVIPRIISFFTEDYTRLSFLVFAFISLSLKIFSIKDYQYFILAVLLYVGNLFFIQEMTTIRASVSSGVLLWSIKDLYEKNDKKFFLKLGFALLFHYSSVMFVLIWLINKFDVKYKWLFIALAFSMTVPILNINFITILHLDAFSDKATDYMTIKKYEDSKLNLFNFKIIIAFLYLGILFWQRKKIKIAGFDILLKTHILSLFFFYLFSTTGLTFSLRSFELLSVVQIVLYPSLIFCFNKKFKLVGHVIVFATAIVFFYYSIFVSDILKDYSSWLF
jgi:hypothetical protein